MHRYNTVQRLIPQSSPGSAWAVLLAMLPAALGLLLLLSDGSVTQTLRNAQFDQLQRWQPRAYVPAQVRIVDIDEASLARLGQWPWPRSRIAALLDRLHEAGASVVAFDMVFAGPDPDTLFIRSLQRSPAVLGFATLAQTSDAQAALPLPKAHMVYTDAAPHTALPTVLHRFAGAVTSLPELEQVAQGNGALGLVPDGDGVVRRVPLVVAIDDTAVPTLVTEALRVAQGTQEVTLTATSRGAGLAGVRIGHLNLPTTPEGDMWLHVGPPQQARTVSAWQVLEGQVPREQLGGAIVLVGSSAHGLTDRLFSPLGATPGVELQAQALEQALDGHVLQHPAWARLLEALLLVVGCGLVWLLALRLPALWSALACLGLLAASLALSWWAFVALDLLLDVVTPALAGVLCYLACSLWQRQQAERKQRWVQQAFAHYVSPNRVAWLMAHPQAFALGGRRQVCSFVFTDLTGFTQLMEGMDPGQAVGLLNTYLDAMVAIAFRHEGTLDRIVGDSVAIMFSAPLEQADHRARALTCALEMDAFASGYARQMQQQGIALGPTRIGVHSGEVIVGNFGGSTVFDYRALGDPVNAAARLESVNKQLGTRICISEDILAGNPGALTRPVGHLLLQGKSRALAVFEPVTPDTVARAPLEDYLFAFEALHKRQPHALTLFVRLAQSWPDDPLVQLHLRRLLAGEYGDQLVMPDK